MNASEDQAKDRRRTHLDIPYYPIFVGGRYLKCKKISYLAILGVCLSVMTLIVVMSVMKGFDSQLRQRVRGQLSHITIEPVRQRLYAFTDWPEIRRQVLQEEHVKAVAPYIEGFALVKVGPRFLHARFKGVDPELEPQVSDINIHLQNFFSKADELLDERLQKLKGPEAKLEYERLYREMYPQWPAPFVEKEAAKALKRQTVAALKKRDTIRDDYASDATGLTRVFLDKNKAQIPAAFVGYELKRVSQSDDIILVTATDDLRRRLKKFRVAGVFKSGMFDWDSSVIIISLKDAMRFVDAGSGVSGLSVKLDDYENSRIVQKRLMDKLGAKGYEVLTWEDKRKTFLTAVKMERVVMAFILMFIMVVAGFCIFAILTMTVLEKRKDIGILKAVGMTKRGVGWVFLMGGMAIGLLGSALGFTLGLLIVNYVNTIERFVHRVTGWTPFPREVYYFDELPADKSLLSPILICCVAIVSSLLFSVIPAWRAARMDPVETLRFE